MIHRKKILRIAFDESYSESVERNGSEAKHLTRCKLNIHIFLQVMYLRSIHFILGINHFE